MVFRLFGMLMVVVIDNRFFCLLVGFGVIMVYWLICVNELMFFVGCIVVEVILFMVDKLE